MIGGDKRATCMLREGVRSCNRQFQLPGSGTRENRSPELEALALPEHRSLHCGLVQYLARWQE